jgi:glyoxylase I family protein
MLKNARVGNIFFYVHNIDETERFYRDVMGLSLQRTDDDGQGSPFLVASIPGNVDLLFFKGEVRPGNSPMLVFELRDGGIDAATDGLARAGATLVTPVSHAPGGWSSELKDPNGYIFSLFQEDTLPR